MSAASVQAAREGRRRGQLETNRWGVLVDEATAIRSRLRRGAAGEDPAATLVDAFERFLVPVTAEGEAATDGDRAGNLGYLADVGIEVEADGSSTQHDDFFAYATGFGGDLGSFASTFESFVAAGTGQGGDPGSAPDASAVASAFETAATGAIGAGSAPSQALSDLIDVLEAGVVAAREHGRSYEAQLTNEFADGSRTSTGLVQQFHDGLGDAETPYAEALFETLGEHPIAMLPVALETSFHEKGGDSGVEGDSTEGGDSTSDPDSTDGDVDRELRVRVYPDDVHVDTHEPELTTQEERWGKVFWTQVYVGRFHWPDPGSDPPLPESTVLGKVPEALEDVARSTLWSESGRDGTRYTDFSDDVAERYEEIKERAWSLLVERAGRERAAYVVRRTEPEDVSGEEPPTTGDDRETAAKLLAGPPEASDAATANGAIDDLSFGPVANRPGSWTRQPRARYLPGRWLVRCEWTDDAGTERSAWVHAEHTVDEPLYVGPEPEALAQARDDHDPEEGKPGTRSERETPNDATAAVDAGMEWMVDFEVAERSGMALRIAPEDLGTETLPDHFDRVTVAGVRASVPAEAATAELAELFEHQQYTDGLELLPPDTTTNNHDGAQSAYRREESTEASAAIEVGEPLTGPTDPTDGTLLAQCLGLPTADGHQFAHVEGADDTEWLDERLLQTALFPGTLGYSLKQLLLPDAIYDGSASDAEVQAAERRYEAIRDHLLDYVRASGPFPALRLGDQPYGVLPAMSIDAGAGSSASVTGAAPDDGAAFVRDVVQFLRPFWAQSVGEVPTAGQAVPTGASTTSLSDVRQVLQRGAVADAYTRRLFLEDRSGGSHQLTQALSNHGVNYDPRLARLKEFAPTSLPEHSEYGPDEFGALGGGGADGGNAGGTDAGVTGGPRQRPSLITSVARPDPQNAYLDALPRMLNSDLLKFGMEPHFERFPGYVGIAYHPQSPITSWGGLSGILDADVDGPIERWLAGDVEEPAIGLFRLVDRSGSGVFESYTERGGGFGSYSLSASNARAVLKHVLTDGSGSGLSFEIASLPEEQVVAALEVLFVDALDRCLKGDEPIERAARGASPLPRAGAMDPMELDADTLGSYQARLLSILKWAMDDRRDWPDGAERLRLFYEGAVEASKSEGEDGIELGEQMRHTLANFFVERLVEKHFDDYVILATTIRGESSERFPHHFHSDAGEHVVPTTARKVEHGDRPPFEAKRIHDTALLPKLLRFSTINAGLDGLARTDRGSYQFSLGDLFEREGAGAGRYDLLTTNTSSSIYEEWGYQSNAGWTGGGHDEIVDGFAGTQWYGLLNAMRYEQFVGKPEVADQFQAFQASLEWIAGTADGPDWANDRQWLAPERIDETRRRTAGVLDLASHRLDAWWTSLATRRLMDLRSGSDDDGFSLPVDDVWVNRTPDESQDTYEPDWSTLGLEAPTGNAETLIGAYGFVEDLVRDGVDVESDDEFEAVDPETLETAAGETVDEWAGEGTAVETGEGTITAESVEWALEEAEWIDGPPATDGGTEVEAEYLQAPSIPQATTAAILRSGHRSEPTQGFKDTLSIDLSPRRVQKAKWVLDGLRSGLWLGELMGYYFERRMHEASEDAGLTLETYISDFREYVPFQGEEIDHDESGGTSDESDSSGEESDDSGVGTTDPAGEAGSAAAKYDLVDGYKLYQEANDPSIDAVLDAVGITGDEAVRKRIATILAEVDEILDALGDLVVAENVYQLQQGNFGQAGRSLKALSEGKHPRRPEVLETKRDSVGLTHRLLVLFGLDDDPPGSTRSPRSAWVPSREVTVPAIAGDGTLDVQDGTYATTTAETVVRDDGAPVLNAFAAGLFPDPGDVRCGATYRWETESTADDGTTTTTEHEVSVAGGLALAALDLSPLDALFLTQQSGEAGASKLENHVAYHLLRNRDGYAPADVSIPADAELDVAFTELPSDAPDDAMAFGEFIEHARSLRDLVLDGRPADATDLGHPGDEADRERVAATPVVQRATDATDRLRRVETVLADRLDVVGTAETAPGAGDGGSQQSGGQQSGGGQQSSGGQQSGGRGSGDDADAIVPPVAELESALNELADAVPLASAASAAGAISGEELLAELTTLLEHLPAGPTDAADAPEPTLVEPGQPTIELSVPAADADLYLPARTVRVRGTHASNGRVDEIRAIDPATEEGVEVGVPSSSGSFDVELDLEAFGHPGASDVRLLRLSISEGDGQLESVHHGETTDVSGFDEPMRVGLVPDGAAVTAFENGTATVDVAVASDSPSSRFRDAKSGRPVASDGTVTAEIDTSGVQVGTRFTATATYTDGSGRVHVAATTEGRVIGPDPANGIDDDLLKGMDSLPQLLWLAGFGDELRVRDRGSPSIVIDRNPIATAVRGEVPPSIESIRSGTATAAGDAAQRGGQSNGGQSASASGGGNDGPSPAQQLSERLEDVPWSAIDRERSLFPSSHTTYEQDDRDAVAALTGCSSVDLVKASDAMNGEYGARGTTSRARGLVPLVDLLALPKAVTVVGQDDPFGEQTYFAPEDPVGLADARARIEAFLDDPWPGAIDWSDPVGLLVDSSLVAFVLDQGVGSAFGDLLELVNDPAWAPATLDPLVAEPAAFPAALEDLLYHPDVQLSRAEMDAVRRGLDDLATAASAAGSSAAGTPFEAFDSVADPGAEVGDPLSTLHGALQGATLPPGGGGESTFKGTVGGWTQDAANELSPLADAHAAGGLTTSLREGLLETLRRPMVRAAYFGVYGAIPTAASGASETDRENLSEQAAAVLETIRERLPPADADDPADLDAAIERLEAIFGEDYTVLPPFAPGNLEEVRRTFGNDGLLTDDGADPDPLPVQSWLQRSARVRERPGMLRETLLYGEIATEEPHLRLDVGQLPHDPDDSWVGLDGVRPGGRDRVSLVAHTDDGFDAIVDGTASGPSRVVAGLYVDEWVERVPAEEETTSVAVRYDEPDNEAPQSILLATPPERATDDGVATADDGGAASDDGADTADDDAAPDDGEATDDDGAATDDESATPPWSLSTVERTFDETIAMTRYRGVTAEDLRPDDEADRWMLGKLFPALYFAQDTHVQPNTPSLDLTSLSIFEEEAGNLQLAPWETQASALRLYADVDPVVYRVDEGDDGDETSTDEGADGDGGEDE